MPERSATGRRRIMPGILVVLVLVSISALLLLQYLKSSTPDRTLDTFCRALQQADYHTAYDQFSATLQRSISEKAFAAPLSQDRVTACTHSSAGLQGKSVLSQLKLVHASQGKNTDILTLVKDDRNNWKIDDGSRASPAVP